MESKVGFLGGMDRDSSLSKRDPNKYYDGMNIRVLTDNGLSTGSVINEKGNSLLFKLPTTLSAIYTVGAQDNNTCSVTITTSNSNVVITTTDPSIEGMYATITANVTVIADTTAKLYRVDLVKDKIVFTGLRDILIVSATSPNTVMIANIASNPEIIGLGTMRDWIIVFSHIPPVGGGTALAGNGQIWKCRYNKITGLIDDISTDNTLDPAIHLVYNNILDFDSDFRVGEVISRYQDSTHGKIFFIDGLNTMKHINVLDPDAIILPLSSINIAPDITFSQPKITEVLKGGALKSGSIQYSYQLFNEGGVESSFAPASGIIHLVEKSEYSSNTLNYRGSAADTIVGKSVKVLVENIDTTFDYIRLISVYYTSQEAQPEINIIEEKSIPSGGSIEFIDDGNPIGVYSVTEYNSIGSRIFIPGTITTKNNYLVAANIKEQYFDIDEGGYWDSRAYRWDGIGHFRIDGVDLNSYSVSETADCILTRTEQEAYRYKQDTSAMGGTGVNIEYEFVLTPIKIDADLDTSKTFTDIDITSQAWNTKLGSTYINNTSYSSYASPINREQLVGYTRDEIYRFGIVFIDSKGRYSFAKWIADIKMPSIRDIDVKVTYIADDIEYYDYNTVFRQTITGNGLDINGAVVANSLTPGIYANVLGIKFNVSNVPAGVSYKIIRVRREQSDKYVLGQGLMGITINKDDGTSVIPHNYIEDDIPTNYNLTGVSTGETYQTLITFKSPEVLFNNSISPQEGDIVETVAYSANKTLYETAIPAPNLEKNIRANKISALAFHEKSTAIVKDGIKASDTGVMNVDYRYIIQNDNANLRIKFKNNSDNYKGTVLALGLKSSITLTGSNESVILNYTKDPSLVQYGGSGYTDRINNFYISCGNLNSGVVFGGDTFIGMFEYINGMFNVRKDSSGDVDINKDLFEVVFVPLESTINVEVSNGTSFSKDIASDTTNWMLCESVSMGSLLHTDSEMGGAYPANYTDIYQYNSAYSVEPIGKTFTPKPQFFQNNQVNDYRVIVSEKHVNNQLTDSWTKFLYNNMIEVNSAYGSINKIITFRNRLFFFQDNAFGILGFEDRQLLNDNTGLPLTLGVGGILTNFQYISEQTGTKSKFGVVDTGSYLYFVDLNNRKFMRFDGNTDQCVSDKDALSSYFRTFDYGNALAQDSTSNFVGIHGVFDPVSKRVLYTMLGTDTSTFSYNEVLDNFESFYSFKPTIYENTDFGVISINPNDLGQCYLHEVGYRGVFYDIAYDSYITHIAAPNPDIKKIFNNLEFNSYVYAENQEAPLVTVSSIELWNSFQFTGVINTENPTTIRRRFRTWRYQIPKVGSLRMMDYSLFVKLSFTNLVSVDRYFRLDDIIAHYLVPIL